MRVTPRPMDRLGTYFFQATSIQKTTNSRLDEIVGKCKMRALTFRPGVNPPYNSSARPVTATHPLLNCHRGLFGLPKGESEALS
jgi:hypothetical protein